MIQKDHKKVSMPSQDIQAFAQLLHVPDFPSVQLPQNQAQNRSQPSSIPHSLQTNSLHPVVETTEEVFLSKPLHLFW